MKSYNFYKWRIWGILAFAFVMSLFHRSALGAISTNVTNTLNLTATELSNLISITFYTYAFMQIPAGILIDKLGYKKMSLLGMISTGLGSIVFGIGNNIFLAYIGRFLIGLGTSVIFTSTLKAQKIWFSKEEFTKASGLLSFIGNLGGVFATFPLAFLSEITGWRNSMIIMGMLCILIATLIYFFTEISPKAYGFEVINKEEVAEVKDEKFIYMKFKEVITSKHTVRNFFILFTLISGTTTLTGLWGIRYLETVYNMTSTEASFYIAFIIYGLVAGSLFVDIIAKIFGEKLYLYPRYATILTAILWVYILFIEEGKPPILVLVIIFFIMGFVAMSHILAFTDVNIHIESSNSGLATSLVNSGEFLGSSIISLIIGGILDLTWNGKLINEVRYYEAESYKIAFCIFLIISILGVITSFIGTKENK